MARKRNKQKAEREAAQEKVLYSEGAPAGSGAAAAGNTASGGAGASGGNGPDRPNGSAGGNGGAESGNVSSADAASTDSGPNACESVEPEVEVVDASEGPGDPSGANSDDSRASAPDQANGAAADAAEEEGSLEDQLAVARAQAAASLDQALRARAELDNVQKRSQRALEERARYAAESLARDLLPAVDDLERALEHSSADASGIVEGVELVLKSLVGALEKHGVTRVETVGQPFDPSVHEAVGMIPTDEVPDGSVAAEHRAGYRLHDRLLRAAMVAVAKAPG